MTEDFGATTQILTLELQIAPKVLLVDDDDLVLAHLQALVEDAGYEVFTATDSTTVLQKLEQNFTPVVILDRNMPDLDGLELCRKIRERTDWPGYIYILLLTMRDAEADILAGLDAGADDYLSKRMSAAQLIARLRTARRILTLEHSLKKAIEEKRVLSMTDSLTGVPNRRYFMRHLTRELKQAQRAGTPLYLVSLDIDHFKRINDSYGHGAGDEVLQEFVRRVGQCLQRENDWCARVGGEEFAVVLAGGTLPGVAVVSERIRQAVAATPFTTETGQRIPVTVSIGVGGVDGGVRRHAVTIESLLQQSDKNLYQSKEGGRNRVTLPG